MKTTLTNPKSTAISGILLALPFMILFLAFVLGLEPGFGSLPRRLNISESHLGSLFIFGALLLLLAAGLINLALIVRDLRAGDGYVAHPANLILAVISLTIIGLFVVGIIVDQYPCWIGVPKCD